MCCSTMRWLGVVLLVSALAATAARGDEIEVQSNVEYGQTGDETLTLHLARPASGEGPFPVIVAIHGGAWRGGNKDIHLPQIKEFAKQGYVAVSVGYRLAPKHRFPAQVEDCKCAVRWLRAHADELNIDPQRIGAIGWSAGAHLAMMLGVMDSDDGLEGDGGWAEESSKVGVSVSYAGPTDLLAELPDVSVPLVATFIGGPRSELHEAYSQASPVSYVTSDDAPMLLFQGTADELVPYDQAITMVRELNKAGVAGRVEFLIGAGHGWGAEEAARTDREAMEFFDLYLKTQSN